MDLGLRNRVALVAAASRGIGFAAARELAREGARVFLCARDEERALQAADRIREETGAEVVVGVRADVTSDTTPANVPFTTPNLGAQLIGSGRTFTGYSESMPSTGYGL